MNHTYKTTTLYERVIHTMIGTLSILAIIYCLVLLALVFSVIERKQSIVTSKELVSELSSLEADYANTVASINESVLAANNFTRVEGATFAVRKDPIASYTVLYAR